MNLEPNAIQALLLDCLSHEPSRVRRADLEQLSSSDWEALLEQAAIQRVRPLLCHRLREQGLDTSAPATVWRQLRDLYLRHSARNLTLEHALREIVDALGHDEIPVIVLKGLYLADIIYGNIALREMNDIDLLIPRNNVAQAAETMMALGYRSAREFSVDLDVDLVTAKHLPRFVRPKGVVVELHWNLTVPGRHYSINATEMWQRSIPATIAGLEVLGLSAEDLLLHLCLHTSYQHQFGFGLRPFCDIAETIQHYGDELDWHIVCRRARQWGWRRGTHLALRLASELLGAAVPEEIVHDLRPAGFSEAIAAAAKGEVLADKATATALTFSLAQLWTTKGPYARVVHLCRMVFPSTLKMSTMYPASPDSPKIYLYYPVRLLHVLRRYARMTWCLLRGNRDLTPLAERGNTLFAWLSEG